MANKRVTELPVLPVWSDDDEVLVTDVDDTSSVPESSPDGTLKRTTVASLKAETASSLINDDGPPDPNQVYSNEKVEALFDSRDAAITVLGDDLGSLDADLAALTTTVDGKVSKSGDTMTGSLDVTSEQPFIGRGTSPRVRLYQSSATATAGFEIWSTATNARLAGLFVLNGSIEDRVGANTSYNVRLAADGVYVRKPTAAGQVPQITTYNAATGQYTVDGIEHGDTGWRNINSLLINGWAANGSGYLMIRRIGNVCHVAMYLTELSPSAATSTTFLQLPAGFRGRTLTYQALSNDLTPSAAVRVFGTPVSAQTTTGIYRPSGTFIIEDTWPTTLPGTQISAPYTLPT